MIHRFLFALALCLPTTSTAQGACEDLWLARNVIYDAHGYCFGSDLGKAMFNNAGCTTVDPKLPDDLQARVDRIWAKARGMECAVDQTKTDIEVYNKTTRYLLMAQPVASGTDAACINAKLEATIELRESPNIEGEPIGTIDDGDTVGWFHEAEGDWHFATVLSKANGKGTASGWTQTLIQNCGQKVE